MTTPPYVDPQSVHDPATGTSPPALWGDTVRDGLEFLARPAGCQANRTTNLTLSNTVWASIGFAAADTRDTDGYHTPPSAQFTIPAGLGGWYLVTLYVDFASNTTGVRGARIEVNAATAVGAVYQEGTSSFNTRFTVTDELLLAPGDILSTAAYQNSGGTLNLESARLTARLVALV